MILQRNKMHSYSLLQNRCTRSKDNFILRQSTKQKVSLHFSSMDKLQEKIEKHGPFPPVTYSTFNKLLLWQTDAQVIHCRTVLTIYTIDVGKR